MNIRDSAPQIFQALSQDTTISLAAKERLKELGTLSDHFFRRLNEETVNNDEVLETICTITSQWRSLIRKSSTDTEIDANKKIDIGSDINRLKLFYAFENVLDKVKLVVTKKQAKVQRKAVEEALLAKKNEGWGSWLINTAATTTNLSIGILNNVANYVVPKSYQNWISDTKDQFIEYSKKLLQESNNEAITFEHILEGIEQWQQFVTQLHTAEETDIRMIELQEEVARQLDDSLKTTELSTEKEAATQELSIEQQAATPEPSIEQEAKTPELSTKQKAVTLELSSEQKREAREYFEQMKKQHIKIVEETEEVDREIEIFAKAHDPLFPSEVEEFILEKGRTFLEDAISKGSNPLSAFTDAVQITVAASLSQIATQGILFASTSQEWVNQSIESIQERSKKAINLVQEQTQATIRNVCQKIADEDQFIRNQGLRVIEQIKFQAETIISYINETSGQLLAPLQKWSVNSYMTKNYSPEAMLKNLNNPTFTKLVDDYIWFWIPTNIPGIKKEEVAVTSDFRDNLLTVLEDQNLQRVGVAALKGMENILGALHKSEGRSPEQILIALRDIEKMDPERKTSKSLQIDPLNLDTYKKAIDRRMAYRLARLAVNRPVGEEMANDIKRNWYILKTNVLRVIIQFVFKNYYHLLPELLKLMKGEGVTEKQLTFFEELKQDASGTATNFFTNYLGLDSILKDFSQQSDIVFYYMIDRITGEMDSIIRNRQNVKTRPSSTESTAQDVNSLMAAIKNFTNPENPILPEALKIQMKPFMSLLEKQGSANSLWDVTTPVVESLVPQWRQWVNT